MTRFAFVATAALASMLVMGPVFAAVRIQTETTDLATNKTTVELILLDASRLRIDTAKNTSMMFLTDGGRNRMVILDKTKNEYREIDEETMNQMGSQMSAAMAKMEAQLKNLTPEQRKMLEQMKGKIAQAVPKTPSTVYTAKGSGSVNGFTCTKYEGVRGAEKIADVCAALPAQLKLTPGDFQVFDKMRQFSSGLQAALGASPVRVNFQTGPGIDLGYEGFPIQRVAYQDGKASERSELKSITPANFTDADFSVGTAKKLDMPVPGGPQSKQR